MVKLLDKHMIDLMEARSRVKDILFKPDLVGAIRRLVKTETRRTRGLKKYNEHPDDWTKEDILAEVKCPYGERGDWLRVRENWKFYERKPDGLDFVEYQAGGRMVWPNVANLEYPGDPFRDKGYKPSIHMPRWCRRLMLENGVVGLERVQEITEDGAKAEGAQTALWHKGVSEDLEQPPHGVRPSYRTGFANLWDSINGKTLPWSVNGWVWKVGFVLIEDKTTEETK